jgi:hypothetical protein
MMTNKLSEIELYMLKNMKPCSGCNSLTCEVVLVECCFRDHARAILDIIEKNKT